MIEDTKKEQIEIAERLQLLVLKEFEAKLKDHDCSGTDLATLVRMLTQNGWTLDAAKLPQGLRDKLTLKDAQKFDREDADIVGKIA